MGWAHRSKVVLVEGRDLRLTDALGESHDACIHHAECQVSVASLQLAAPGQVSARWRLGAVDPRKQIVEEDEPGPALRRPAPR